MRFSYSNPTNITLSSEQEELLATLDEVKSPLQGISHIGDLRCRDGVEVFIVDNDYILNYLNNRKKSLNNAIQKSSSKVRTDKEEIKSKYLEPSFKNIKDSITRAKEGILLGLYSIKLSWFEEYKHPAIFLIADNIENYSTVHKIDAGLVFGFVYVHEMMHAYYDSLNYRGYPSATELEEAFAECGMLFFLDELKGYKPFGEVFYAAEENVRLKQATNALPHYGFGLSLFQKSKREKMLSENIERYREISNWINEIPTREEFKIYTDLLCQLYPSNDRTEQLSDKCYLIVKKILDGNWHEPRIRVKRVGSEVRSEIIASNDMWIIHINKANLNGTLYPIYESRNIAKITACVLKVLKPYCIEAYFHTRVIDAEKGIISIDFNNGSTFIEDIFRITEHKVSHHIGMTIIPEDLSLGKPYYPKIGDEKTICENILQLITETIPWNVSLMKGCDMYTLWGDSDAKQIFEQVIGQFTTTHHAVQAPSYFNRIFQFYTIQYRGEFVKRCVMQRVAYEIFKDISQRDISDYQSWPVNNLDELLETINPVGYQSDNEQSNMGYSTLISVSDYNKYLEQLALMNATSNAHYETIHSIDLSKFPSSRSDTEYYVRTIEGGIVFRRFRKIIKEFGYEIEEA